MDPELAFLRQQELQYRSLLAWLCTSASYAHHPKQPNRLPVELGAEGLLEWLSCRMRGWGPAFSCAKVAAAPTPDSVRSSSFLEKADNPYHPGTAIFRVAAHMSLLGKPKAHRSSIYK
jgi:hypothetical protein